MSRKPLRHLFTEYIGFLKDGGHLVPETNFSIEKSDAKLLWLTCMKVSRCNWYMTVLFMRNMGFIKKKNDGVDKHILTFNIDKYEKHCGKLEHERNIPEAVDQTVLVYEPKRRVIVNQYSSVTPKSSAEAVVTKTSCKLCGIALDETKYEDHLRTVNHKFRAKFFEASKQKKTAEKLKVIITIEEFTMDSIILRKGVDNTVTLKILNKEDFLISLKNMETLINPEVTVARNYKGNIQPGSEVQIKLKVSSRVDGDLLYPVLFNLAFKETKISIPIKLVFRCYSADIAPLLPIKPYKRVSKSVFEEIDECIILGEGPPKPIYKSKETIPLEKYLLPKNLLLVINSGMIPEKLNGKQAIEKFEEVRSLLNVEDKKNPLKIENYSQLLDLLLYFEEHQLQKNIHDYDRDNQVLKCAKNSNLLVLEVLGLAEKRPSLVRNDFVYAKTDPHSTIKYQGIVHHVECENVFLGFNRKFRETFLPNAKYFISFGFKRTVLRVEHQAVRLISECEIKDFLFPDRIPSNVISRKEIKPINRLLLKNEEQLQAIDSILRKSSFPAPYLIFGPPGTGKTMTIVEAITQIYYTTKAKVLLCAPSNNAVNEVVKRLIGQHVPSASIFRYVSESFPYSEIPTELHGCINYDREKAYFHPSNEELLNVRIVATTLCTAARLYNRNFKTDHFDYVFIDEAGHATESETLVALAGIVCSKDSGGSPRAQIVLAGDPKQLGPIIHSEMAKQYGFDISMLERLMNRTVYRKDEANKFDGNGVTKLLKNYRSHRKILKISSRLFYDDELEAAGDANFTHAAIGWDFLPNPEFPFIFHGSMAMELREANSPSFFNAREVEHVMTYLNNLMGSKMRGIRIKEEHIGIITPYKKQARKIKQMCKKRNYDLDKLLIGSVDQIQGQERLIIIISTVRSQQEFIQYDLKFHLGFLKNPKRLNVAVTRAKALLIIIGNPLVLQYDYYWRELLDYVMKNGGYKGPEFHFSAEALTITRDNTTIDQIAQNFAQLSLNGEQVVDGPSFSRGEE